MRDVWFISDTHFGHKSVIPYCRPQFANLDEMHEHIINKWNALVKPQDLVYHLGDFAWTLKAAKEFRPKLNGSIRLIVGNHDDIPKLAAAGLFQRIQMWRVFKDFGFTATHVPLRADQLRHGVMNLHGHVHGNCDGLDWFHRDMSVETTNFEPTHIEDISDWAAKGNSNSPSPPQPIEDRG